MVHIIFLVTWAALLHHYLPVLPAVEWGYFAPPHSQRSATNQAVGAAAPQSAH